MCKICRQTICPSGCPNAPEPTPVYRCDSCGEPIYAGDTYYYINYERWCEDCIDEARSEAEE